MLAEVGTEIASGGGEIPEDTEFAAYWGDGPGVDVLWLAAYRDIEARDR